MKTQTESKHTAGPWQFSGVNSREVFDHANCYPVCTVQDRVHYDNATVANAQLIASAPCLLAALEQWAELMMADRIILVKGSTLPYDEVCARTIEAISKAKGQP